MARTRTAQLGPAAWPVAVPDDVDDAHLVKASGEVELPHHIRWSGPPLAYDLDNPIDRARVYEQVLREGTDDDVRFYIEVDELLALWDRLVLPPQVRRGWVRWFRQHRGLELACCVPCRRRSRPSLRTWRRHGISPSRAAQH